MTSLLLRAFHRQALRMTAAMLAAVSISGCVGAGLEETDLATLGGLNSAVDAPAEGSSANWRAKVAQAPDVIAHRRGFAAALMREDRYDEAHQAWTQVLAMPGATMRDREEHLASLVHLKRWSDAETALDQLDAAPQTERRLVLAGIIYDNRENWIAADFAYSRLFVLAQRPETALNNWGMSKLSRGDYPGAAQTFRDALDLRADFTKAKINLAIAHGLMGDYQLPSSDLTPIETAQTLHDLGVIALQRGEYDTAHGLFQRAIQAHPSRYENAARRLEELAALRAGRTQ